MKALRALLVLLTAIPAAASASEKGYPLQEANADVSNLASLQRGARNFVNYCLGCHSAKYMRYSQLATDLALKEDDVQASLMFAGGRIYDTMDTAMPAEKARQSSMPCRRCRYRGQGSYATAKFAWCRHPKWFLATSCM